MQNSNVKTRLIVLSFLQFAVWGAYLTSMGRYLGSAGMGSDIGWFYSVQGIVSIFMPALIGIIADRWGLRSVCSLSVTQWLRCLWASQAILE